MSKDARFIARWIIACALLIAIGSTLGHLMSREQGPKHPTYHCDASNKLGYAKPGTPEARACWIEEQK